MTFKSLLAITGVAVGAFAIVAYFRKRKQAEPIPLCPYTKEPCDFKSCEECQHDYHLSKKIDPSAFLTPDEEIFGVVGETVTLGGEKNSASDDYDDESKETGTIDWEQATTSDDESDDEPEYFDTSDDEYDDESEYSDTSDDEYEDEAELDWEQATTSNDEPDDEPDEPDDEPDEPDDEPDEPEYFKTSDEDEGDTSYFDISDEDKDTSTSASDDFYDLDTESDTGTSASDDFDDIDTESETGTTDESEVYRHLETASDEFDSVEEVDTPEYRPEVSAIE